MTYTRALADLAQARINAESALRTAEYLGDAAGVAAGKALLEQIDDAIAERNNHAMAIRPGEAEADRYADKPDPDLVLRLAGRAVHAD